MARSITIILTLPLVLLTSGCLETDLDRYNYIEVKAGVDCQRPHLASVINKQYYCKLVDDTSGTDCIEKSTVYRVLKSEVPPAQPYSYDRVLWGKNLVEFKKVITDCEIK